MSVSDPPSQITPRVICRRSRHALKLNAGSEEFTQPSISKHFFRAGSSASIPYLRRPMGKRHVEVIARRVAVVYVDPQSPNAEYRCVGGVVERDSDIPILTNGQLGLSRL